MGVITAMSLANDSLNGHRIQPDQPARGVSALLQIPNALSRKVPIPQILMQEISIRSARVAIRTWDRPNLVATRLIIEGWLYGGHGFLQELPRQFAFFRGQNHKPCEEPKN